MFGRFRRSYRNNRPKITAPRTLDPARGKSPGYSGAATLTRYDNDVNYPIWAIFHRVRIPNIPRLGGSAGSMLFGLGEYSSTKFSCWWTSYYPAKFAGFRVRFRCV